MRVKQPPKLTLVELSKKLGFSVATVSSVLNNREAERRISPETVKTIREAVKKMGYRPNYSARRLRKSKGKTLDLALITSFNITAFSNLTLLALNKAKTNPSYLDYSLSIEVVIYEGGKLAELTCLTDEVKFDGAIICNTLKEDDEWVLKHHIPFPTVFIGRELSGYNCIRVDEKHTGINAAETLIKACSCNRPAINVPKVLTQSTRDRLESFIEKCESLGRSPITIFANGFDEESGHLSVNEYLENSSVPFDGLFCSLDTFAVGAYHAIKNHGLSIPEDIAVIGVGDSSICPYLDPPLSSFGQSQSYLHEQAVQLLLKQLIENDKTVTNFILPSIPVQRESTRRTIPHDFFK